MASDGERGEGERNARIMIMRTFIAGNKKMIEQNITI